jgi:hypothetical protein
MNRNRFITSIIICCILSMSLGTLLAQKTLDSMLIISVGEYKPTIINASKINENPVISDSTKKLSVTPYNINSKKINTNFAVEPIKPAQMVGEPLTKLYNSLVKLGLGNYATPYGELWINNLRSKDLAVGARLKHFSSNFRPKNYGPAFYSDNEISLYGKKFLKDHTLIGNIDYARNLVHLYGYDTRVYALSSDTTQRIFNLIGGNVQFKSQYSGANRIHHDIKLNYYNLTGPFKSSENNIKANGVVQTAIGKEQLKVNALVDFYNYKMKYDTVNNTITTLNPNFIAKGERYAASLGFTATMDVVGKSKFYFYPKVDFSYNVFEDIIIPYVGVTGGLQKNSYKSLKDSNPFISSELFMRNSNVLYEVFGGIKGTISSTTSFNACASYNRTVDMPLFVIYRTDPRNQNQFIVIFDNAQVLKVNGEVGYQLREKLRINLRGDYYNYKMKTELRAWYKPQVQITLSGNYNLRDKIVIKADLFYIGNQFAETYVWDGFGEKTVAKELRGIFDANVGAEYRYTKNLGFFINFNNIANYQYYRWSNYPTQRFSLMGGLSYSF